MDTVSLLILIVLFSPLLTGIYVAFFESAAGVTYAEKIESFLIDKYESFRATNGFLHKYILSALVWPFCWLASMTLRIQDEYLRAGIGFIAFGYMALIELSLVGFVFYVALVIAFYIAILVAILYFLSMGGEGGSRQVVTSHKREGLLGERYVEHVDEDGNVIAESREQEGLFGGKYTEHTDAEGNVIAESRKQEGLFGGEYTEHTDAEGNVIAESREQEGLFGGKYTEYTDAEGNVTGESREQEGLFGERYIETEKVNK